MYLPGINNFRRFVFLFPFLLLTHCGSAQVLNTARHEASELLKNGDTDFIRQADLPEDFSQAATMLNELSLIHDGAAFYSALLIGNSPQPDRELELLLFCAALESPSLTVRREAALKIIPLILEAEESREAADVLGFLDSRNLRRSTDRHLAILRTVCLYRLGRYSQIGDIFAGDSAAAAPVESGSRANLVEDWGKSVALLASWKTSPTGSVKNDFSDFLFTITPGEILRWANEEAGSLEGLFSHEDLMLLSARLITGNYRVMLLGLRPSLQDGGSVFFRYPNLIAYLGRAFQFTAAARGEGARIFESWIRLLDTGEPSGETQELAAVIATLDDDTIKAARYMTLFYAGRITRALGNLQTSTDYFWRALEVAPDAVQSDACIWYILMNAMSDSPSAAASQVMNTLPQWNDFSTFSSIVDRISNHYARQRQWNEIFELFLRLETRGPSALLAQYAYIAGRTVEEGYIRTSRSPESFFRTAFEAENASFYYRAMAASKLGLNVALERDSGAGRAAQPGAGRDEAEFLLGFFEYGAASFFLPYLRAFEEELPFHELRRLAEALAASGNWIESLRLIGRYTRRADYEFSIEDLFLSHPRPYLELVEKYTQEMEIGPEMFYGLIRTESHFMSAIVSHAGAVGLAQFMPATALDMATRIARRGGPDYYSPNGIDLTDPEINIHLGTFYMRNLIDLLDNPMLALLAYNGGQGRVRRWVTADRQRGALPLDLFLETVEFTETREYGRRVLSAAAVYGYLYYDMSMEEVAANIFR